MVKKFVNGGDMKYFIVADDSEGEVYSLKYFQDYLRDKELEEIVLLEMKREIGGEMWCEKEGYFVEEYDCGVLCKDYSPCNGKNGRCRFLKNGFIETGRKFKLTPKGLKEA